MPLMFEQQVKESDKAFAAFSLYLSQGPERSLAKVARKLGKSKSAIAAWSRKHHWQDRIGRDTSPRPPLPPDREPSPARSTSVTPVNPVNHVADNAAHPPCAKRLDDSQLSTLNSQLPLHPWDQQPGETGKNFAAFTKYLALGSTRTLAQTAAATGRTRDQLAHWSQRWRWRHRAAAYHAHLAKVERESTEALVREKSHDWLQMHEGIKRQAWKEAEDLILLAQDFKARWRDSDRLPDFGALIRAIELAFKLKQFAAGMPSEIKAVNTTVTGPDGGPIMLEFEAAVRKIYGTPIPAEVVDVEPLPDCSAGVPPASPGGVPAALSAPEHPGETAPPKS